MREMTREEPRYVLADQLADCKARLSLGPPAASPILGEYERQG
jgi:hypothetical protein